MADIAVCTVNEVGRAQLEHGALLATIADARCDMAEGAVLENGRKHLLQKKQR